MCTVSAVILTYSLLVATSTFVNSEKHKLSDYSLFKRNVHNRTNHPAMLNHGSFYRLSTYYGVWEEIKAEAKSNQNRSQSKFYGISDTAASEASNLVMNPTEYEVKDGSHYTDVAKTEFATTRPPLNLSPDQIIDVPRRRCPDGKKMDPFGKCKTVWNT
jgi:hypothetical protein